MQRISALKKVSTLLGVVLFTAVVFSGCMGEKSEQQSTTSDTMDMGESGAPAAEEKQGDTTKTGTISETNGDYYLTEAGQTPKMIESYAVDLSQYVGQTITVTGQYSGDTLFVGKVE